MKTTTLLVATLILSTMGSAAPLASPTSDTQPYAEALRTFVDSRGMVDYEGLKKNPQALNTYLRYISTVPEQTIDQWSDVDKIAFWINAYNGLTLKAILDHYPIKSSFFRSLTYPKNSIRQIPGVWNKLKFSVHNRPMTLEHIEHKILRLRFNEPRIHVALVCAAKGCPPLRNEPYVGQTLDTQLNDQTATFMADLTKFKIDRKEGIVYLSSIFKWFGEDFVATYAPPENAGDLSQTLSAVMNYLTTHVDALFKPYLLRGKYKVKYLKYDWSLNEQ
ncbi:MAG: DUF547 domain-containing protein [Phycisphaeraceae bacterium]|nr:DUF547 domain-containing protein [Phycisphaeraceae bacterium]